jgi:cytochrome c2
MIGPADRPIQSISLDKEGIMFDVSRSKRLALSIGSAAAIMLLPVSFSAFAESREDIKSPDSRPGLSIIRIKGNGYKGLSPSALSKNGESLFADLNCTACHGIHNVGGSIGPILDGVGGRRSGEYMEAKLTDTDEAKKQFAAHAIVAYLLTISDPPGGYVVQGHTRLPADVPEINKSFRPEKASADSHEGAKLYNEFGCVACHSIGDIGGWLGPALDGVGGRRSREFISAHISNAQAHMRKLAGKDSEVVSEMPRFNATAEQIKKIVTYLETLPNRTN